MNNRFHVEKMEKGKEKYKQSGWILLKGIVFSSPVPGRIMFIFKLMFSNFSDASRILKSEIILGK